MKKLIAMFLGLTIISCGGGGDGGSSDRSNNVPSVQPGIYSGTVVPSGGTPDGAIALIASDGRVGIVDIDTIEAFIGTLSNNSLSGTLYSTSVASATGEITSVSGNNIDGTYSSALGGGSFSLVLNPNLSSRSANLSKLEGVWVDSIFTNVTGTTTWVIQTDGSFSMSSTSDCSASGQFSLIDSSRNEYDIQVTITNCLSYNGTYSGIGALSDTYFSDDTLSFIFNNGSIGGLFEPIKQ